MEDCVKFLNGECDNCNECEVEDFLEDVKNGEIEIKDSEDYLMKLLERMYS